MKHLSSIVLAAVVLAAGAVACFKDPTSSVRNGPTRILLTRSSVDLEIGDSLQVQAEVKDEQGNTFDAADAVWTSSNSSIAAVHPDTSTSIPFNAVSRAFIVATADTNGGVAYIFVTSAGIKDSVRVLVPPTGLTATAVVTGTARTDTIGTTAISAGDTILITSTSAIRFDTTLTQITLGTKRAYVFSRTPTVVKAIAMAPFTGRPWVTSLWYSGPPEVGNVTLRSLGLVDSMLASNITVSRPRYYPTITVTADTMFLTAPTGTTFDSAASTALFLTSTSAAMFARTTTQLKVINTGASYTGLVTVRRVKLGTTILDSLVSAVPATLGKAAFTGTVTQLGDTMTVTPPTGFTFNAATANVGFGTTTGNAIVLSRTASSLKVMSPVTYTGPVTVTGVKIGLVTVSLSTPASYTINAATFVGTVTTAGKLLDTVKVYAGTGFKFTTTPAASVSNVMIGGVTAFVLLRTADSMYVISKLASTGQIGVTNATVGGSLIPPKLNIAGNVVIGPTTGEVNEPGNDLRATATPIAFTGTTDTITIYGSLDCEDDGTACPGNGDLTDYYSIVMPAGQNLKGILTFMGTGNPGASYNDANNPDLDVCFRNATSYLGTCTSTNGAGLNMPETATTAVVGGLVADTYWYRVQAWVTIAPIAYKLQIIRVP